MALDLKKFHKLKNWNQNIVSKLVETDVYKGLDENFLTDKGLTANDIKYKIDSLNSCADILQVSVEKKKHTVHSANFCRAHCVCPICASRVQSMRRARFTDHIKAASTNYKNAYLVTWTIESRANLAGMVDDMLKFVRRFRKMGQKRITRNGEKTHSKGEWSKVKGGLISYEIKKGKRSQKWHVHAHAIVFSNVPLDYRLGYDTVRKNGKNYDVSKIQKEWFLSTNGEGLNINVQKMQRIPKKCSKSNRYKYSKMTYAQSIGEQAKEVLKYQSKLNPNDSGDIIEILSASHYRRMFTALGCFYGIKGDDFELKIEDADKKDIYTIFWDKEKGEYCRTMEKDLISELREVQATSAKIMGAYRRKRKKLFEFGLSEKWKNSTISRELDYLKKCYMKKIFDIWNGYKTHKVLLG